MLGVITIAVSLILYFIQGNSAEQCRCSNNMNLQLNKGKPTTQRNIGPVFLGQNLNGLLRQENMLPDTKQNVQSTPNNLNVQNQNHNPDLLNKPQAHPQSKVQTIDIPLGTLSVRKKNSDQTAEIPIGTITLRQQTPQTESLVTNSNVQNNKLNQPQVVQPGAITSNSVTNMLGGFTNSGSNSNVKCTNVPLTVTKTSEIPNTNTVSTLSNSGTIASNGQPPTITLHLPSNLLSQKSSFTAQPNQLNQRSGQNVQSNSAQPNFNQAQINTYPLMGLSNNQQTSYQVPRQMYIANPLPSQFSSQQFQPYTTQYNHMLSYPFPVLSQSQKPKSSSLKALLPLLINLLKQKQCSGCDHNCNCGCMKSSKIPQEPPFIHEGYSNKRNYGILNEDISSSVEDYDEDEKSVKVRKEREKVHEQSTDTPPESDQEDEAVEDEE